MKLVSLQIRNVKSIVDTGLCHLSDSQNITVLAGQNEAGKSAVLEALDFFGNGASVKFKRLCKRYDNPTPQVSCTFSLALEDKTQDKNDISDILLDMKEVTFFRSGDETPIVIEVQSEELIKNKIHDKFLKAAKDEEKDALVEDDIFNEISKHLISLIPKIVLYSSFEDLLPGEITLKDAKSNKAVQDFEKVFKVDFESVCSKEHLEQISLLSKLSKEATVDLNKFWHQKQTTEEDDHYQYQVTINPNTADKNASIIYFAIHRNDDRPLYIEQKSKGFQWFSAFNLRLKGMNVDSGNYNKYIVLIDEPGQGLHETAQKDVKLVLEELAGKGMQIIYSTHNPQLIGIDGEEFLRIRLVYQKSREEGTKVSNLAQFSSAIDGGSIDTLTPIITAMGISHASQIINRTEKLILVEGITDHYYFTAMKKLLNIPDEQHFIPACGVNNIKPLLSVLIGWGANYKTVFDDGTDGRRLYKEFKKNLFPYEDDEFSKRVYKMDDFMGIEDLFSRTDFSSLVLEQDAETDEYRSLKNSEIAKLHKKELLARKFLEKANGLGAELTDETKTNFSKVFEWFRT